MSTARSRQFEALASSLFAILLASAAPARAQCQPGWSEFEFGNSNIGAFDIIPVRDVIEYDDGSGRALFMGGSMATVGGNVVSCGIAKYKDKRWSFLPVRDLPAADAAYPGGKTYCFAAFDPDASGPLPQRLVCGGQWGEGATAAVTVWDGVEMATFEESLPALNAGNDVISVAVHSITAWDSNNDGLTELYIVGDFRGQDGTLSGLTDVVRYVPDLGRPVAARWERIANPLIVDGTAWYTSTLFDDGTGTALYVGGNAQIPGVAGTANIARYRYSSATGHQWEPVGFGLGFSVHRLVSFDADGSGPAPSKLFAIGVDQAASWDGSNWTAHPFDTVPAPCLPDETFHAAVVNEATGPALIIRPAMQCAPQTNLLKFNGSSFSAWSGNEQYMPQYIGVHDLGQGPRLTSFLDHVRQYDGTSWRAMVASEDLPHMESIEHSFVVDPDGSGPGGQVIIASGVAIDHTFTTAMWDGSSWAALRQGLPSGTFPREAAAGSGSPGVFPQLLYRASQIVGIDPDGALTVEHYPYLRSSQGTWTRLGTDAFVQQFSFAPFKPHVMKIGAVESLVLVTETGVKQWSGSAWTDVGVFSPSPLLDVRSALVTDAAGTKLYVSHNSLQIVNGVPITGRVAVWDGSTWSDASAGLPLTTDPNFANYPSLDFVVHAGQLHAAPREGQVLLPSGEFKRTIFRLANGAWQDSGLRSPIVPLGAGSAIHVILPVAGSVQSSNGQHQMLAQGFTLEPYAQNWLFELYEVPTGNAPGTPRADLGKFVWDGYPYLTRVHNFSTPSRSGIILTGPFMGVGGVDQALPGWGIWAQGVRAVDSQAIAFLVTSCTSACPADFNNSGGVTVQDIFDFLTAWFSGDVRADVNGTAGITVQDIFDFLSFWFTGC